MTTPGEMRRRLGVELLPDEEITRRAIRRAATTRAGSPGGPPGFMPRGFPVRSRALPPPTKEPTMPKPTRPALVGLARGAAEAAAIAALGVLVAWLGIVDLGPWNFALPSMLLGVRALEGVADDYIDPSVQRGRLGGTPADR